jgi:ATP-dependent 26S proteasome regulatory subunit
MFCMFVFQGPELFRKYVGESERCVRDVFKRARQVRKQIITYSRILVQ